MTAVAEPCSSPDARTAFPAFVRNSPCAVSISARSDADIAFQRLSNYAGSLAGIGDVTGDGKLDIVLVHDEYGNNAGDARSCRSERPLAEVHCAHGGFLISCGDDAESRLTA